MTLVAGGGHLREVSVPIACGVVLPTTLAGMRPRSLTTWPCCFPHARISPVRAGWLLSVRRGGPGACPALRACSMWDVSSLRKGRHSWLRVDLTAGAIHGEPHGVLRRAAGQIVFQRDGHFCAVNASPVAMLAAPYPGPCAPPSPAPMRSGACCA
jgi:hypothetical protein